MIRIHCMAADGTSHDITAQPGQTLMQAATAANLKGIEADCGGTLTCATCHVIVPPEWASRLPAPGNDERAMLEFTATPAQPNSRLSCQIDMTSELDGLVVQLPASQH